MNIAYSCNDSYIPQTGISMISLFENNRDVDNICIFLVSKDVSAENVQILRQIADTYHRQFREIKFEDIAYDLQLSNIGRHIETIYSKVFFSRITDVDKMIYFDSDIVIVGSLKSLWEDNLENVYMGVVETFPSIYYRELGLPKGDRFFNDGMAIVNVDYCRKHHLIEQSLKIIEEYNGNPPTLSEGLLNKICYGKIKYISPRYNLLSGILYACNLDSSYLSKILHYSQEELEESCSRPVVIHYLASFYNRPWFKGCTHPLKGEYIKYKNKSPWKDDPLKVSDLPWKRVWMDRLYRWFGYRNIEVVRKTIKMFNL